MCVRMPAGAQGLGSVAAHVPGIVHALGTAVLHPKLPQASRELIISTIAQLRQHFPAQADQLIAALPAPQQKALMGAQ